MSAQIRAGLFLTAGRMIRAAGAEGISEAEFYKRMADEQVCTREDVEIAVTGLTSDLWDDTPPVERRLVWTGKQTKGDPPEEDA